MMTCAMVFAAIFNAASAVMTAEEIARMVDNDRFMINGIYTPAELVAYCHQGHYDVPDYMTWTADVYNAFSMHLGDSPLVKLAMDEYARSLVNVIMRTVTFDTERLFGAAFVHTEHPASMVYHETERQWLSQGGLLNVPWLDAMWNAMTNVIPQSIPNDWDQLANFELFVAMPEDLWLKMTHWVRQANGALTHHANEVREISTALMIMPFKGKWYTQMNEREMREEQYYPRYLTDTERTWLRELRLQWTAVYDCNNLFFTMRNALLLLAGYYYSRHGVDWELHTRNHSRRGALSFRRSLRKVALALRPM